MKKFILSSLILAALISNAKAEDKKTCCYQATVVSQNLKFNEGSVSNGSSLLLSNFGTEQLNPLNTEGKGYIVQLTGNDSRVLIPADGNLSAPKGMALASGYLYIADVNKVVVYNLNNLRQAPRILTLPEGNLFVNDIAIAGHYAYVSVTNTGKLFKLDISDPANLTAASLSEYADVPGANGLVIDNHTLYIASYPADGNTTPDNVIYKIDDLAKPVPSKLIDQPGQYDGIAIGNNKLFFTSWTGTQLGYVDLKDGSIHAIQLNGATLTGPADISFLNGKLYIPNLPSSEVVIIDVN